MKKIVLLCNGGLSTRILVRKMKASADTMSYDCEISAAPVADAEVAGARADIILLGPQVRFRMKVVKKQVSCSMVSIGPMVCGTINGEKILNQARKKMDD